MLGTKILSQFFLDNSINLISFITTIIIARIGGPEVLGIIGFTLATLSIIAFIGDLGLTQVHIKQVSSGYNLAYANGIFYLLKSFLVFIILLISLIYLIFFLDKSNINDYDSNLVILFLIMLFGFLFSYFGQSLLITLQAKREVIKYNLPFLLGRLSKLVIIIIASFTTFRVATVFLGYLIEGIIILISALILILKYPLKLPRLQDFKTYLHLMLPFLIWIPLANFAGNIDRLILKNFWGLSEVGFFFAIQSLITLPQSISTAGMNLFYPEVSELASKKEFVKLQNYTSLIVKYLTLVVTPITLLIVIFAKYLIILILGPAFEKATLTLQIFAISILMLTISRPYSYVLLGSNHHKIVPIVNFFIIVLVFILELIFIPKSIANIELFGLGSAGAALAYLVSWTISLFVFAFYSFKYLKIKFYSQIYKSIISGGLMFIVIKWLELYLNNSVFSNLFISIIGILVFIITIILLKEVNKTDYIYLKTIIRPNTLIESIKKEWSKKQ